MDIVNLLVSLVSGAVGGNVAGAAWKEKSLGAIGNTIAGLVGGGLGTFILQAMDLLNKLGLADQTIGSVLANVGAGGVSGAILTIVVGYIKSALAKK